MYNIYFHNGVPYKVLKRIKFAKACTKNTIGDLHAFGCVSAKTPKHSLQWDLKNNIRVPP